MYGWIWRHLPGGTALKTIEALALLAAVVVVLFALVFPWAQRSLPFLDVTVETAGVPNSHQPASRLTPET